VRQRSPTLPGPDEQRAIQAYWAVYEAHRTELLEKVRASALAMPDFVAVIRGMTPEQLDEEDRIGLQIQRKAVLDGDWAAFCHRLHAQGVGYAHAGIPFAAWFELTSAYRFDAKEYVRRDLADDPDALLLAIDGLDRFIDLSLAGIGVAYLEEKESIILQQQGAIRELSTPVLTLSEGLLILPVVGMVDSDRARGLTETLLNAVRDKRARVVVMDITGVPVVDSKVANHFVQTVEAARLMGTEVIVTGISPEIAQTLVTIGASFGPVRTLGDLESGVEVANKILEKFTKRDPR
jgi:anti-anti-sigma regulatory factor